MNVNENKKIAIIGSGALGTSFANLLIDAGQKNVVVYGINQEELNDLENGYNKKYFGDFEFNKIKTTNSLCNAIDDASYIVIAIPSLAITSVIEQILPNLKKEVLFVNGSKGFFPNTELSIHSGIVNKFKNNPYFRGCVTISGPSFAQGIIEKSLTTICAISKNIDHAIEVQNIFYTSYFKLYTQTDVIGAEVGGIYKNILAIGSGIITELGYKINTIASFLTRGMHEMATFNKFMGGDVKTIYGLTGLGDLILTATDNNSRNYTFGRNFVKKKNIDNKNNITLEGLSALSIVESIRKRNNLYLPIVQSLYNIIVNGKEIQEEIDMLWNSELKNENN